jgi:hypothetical protein
MMSVFFCVTTCGTSAASGRSRLADRGRARQTATFPFTRARRQQHPDMPVGGDVVAQIELGFAEAGFERNRDRCSRL